MAVEKMHFINIAGKLDMMDTYVLNSIVPYDIQLEKAADILESVKGMEAFTEPNPYERLNKSIRDLVDVIGVEIAYDPEIRSELIPAYQIEPEVGGYERQLETIQHISRSLKKDLSNKLEIRRQIEPIKSLNVEVDEMFHFTYMKFRFGKMPKDSYEKIKKTIVNLDAIAFSLSEVGGDVYLMYFTPRAQQGTIDSLFASLFFQRIRISDDVKGYPKEALEKLDAEIKELEERIEMLDNDSKAFVQRNFRRLQELYNFTVQLNEVFDIRKYAMHSKNTFYLTGWIPESQKADFKEYIEGQDGISCVFEEDEAVTKSPPTKLRNHWLIQPFESIVKMYGTPSYDELDPTLFVAITYTLLFGIMFGDLGQGIVIALGGLFLYKKRGIIVGKLGIYLGIASCISGFFYGSLFGDEEILRHTFPGVPMINPMEYKMEALGITIGLGVVFLLIAMVLNLYNNIRQEEYGKLFFDRNGLAGLLFYLLVLYIGIRVFMGNYESNGVIVLLIIVSLTAIFFAHPLENLLKKRKHIFPKDRAGFIIETFFELFETVLSLFSNTVSFMRVGAFALNHVGFFLAFHKIADIVGGSGSIIVMILGNILIIALEGLIVGIQSLRLEYYELFSKFFKGEGIEFKPFKISEYFKI